MDKRLSSLQRRVRRESNTNECLQVHIIGISNHWRTKIIMALRDGKIWIKQSETPLTEKYLGETPILVPKQDIQVAREKIMKIAPNVEIIANEKNLIISVEPEDEWEEIGY